MLKELQYFAINNVCFGQKSKNSTTTKIQKSNIKTLAGAGD